MEFKLGTKRRKAIEEIRYSEKVIGGQEFQESENLCQGTEMSMGERKE